MDKSLQMVIEFKLPLRLSVAVLLTLEKNQMRIKKLSFFYFNH